MLKSVLRRSVNILPWAVRTRIHDIPVIRDVQRWVFQRFLSGSEFTFHVNAGPARGLNYPVQLPQDKNIWTGTYEPEFSTEIARRVVPGSVCFDIGGFRGFFAGVMACRGASKVFIFEPFPENIAQIERMIALNPDRAIQVVSRAVAAMVGVAGFEVMPEASMGKLSYSPFDSGGSESVSQISVSQISLDVFVFDEGNPAPDLIKIDVEGAELEVLRGAMRLLREASPVLLIEVHSPEIGLQCFELLKSQGYKVRILQTGASPQAPDHPMICHYAAEKVSEHQ